MSERFGKVQFPPPCLCTMDIGQGCIYRNPLKHGKRDKRTRETYLIRRIPMNLAKFPTIKVVTPAQHRIATASEAFAFSWAGPQPYRNPQHLETVHWTTGWFFEHGARVQIQPEISRLRHWSKQHRPVRKHTYLCGKTPVSATEVITKRTPRSCGSRHVSGLLNSTPAITLIWSH